MVREAALVSGRRESSSSIRLDHHPPMLEVNEAMVVAAEEHGVRLRGLASVLPEDDVVDIALLGGTVTARADAGAVTRRDRTAKWRRNSASGAAHIDHLRRPVHHDSRDG